MSAPLENAGPYGCLRRQGHHIMKNSSADVSGRLTHSPFLTGRGEQRERAWAKPPLARSPAERGPGKAPARTNAARAVLRMLPDGLCSGF